MSVKKYADSTGLTEFWAKTKGLSRVLTQAEYEALSQSEKMNGTAYYISDGIINPDEYNIVHDSVPVGSIQAYASSTTPYGWLACDGSEVNRALYSELFAAIGTTYGDGDGTSTFNLPDLNGRTIIGIGESDAAGHTNHTLGQSDGEETHVLTINEMPSHAHEQQAGTSDGHINREVSYYATGTSSGSGSQASWFSASRLTISTKDTGGGQPHNNMPPYLATNYIIKAKNLALPYSTISHFDPEGLLLETFYPAGSRYETLDVAFDPNIAWGGTWTKETISDDYVVEEGVDGIWTYRKWNSGISECWGYKDWNVTSWTAWGSNYYSSTCNLGDYPLDLFAGITTMPDITINAMKLSGSGGARVWTTVSLVGDTVTGPSDIAVMRSTTGGTDNVFRAVCTAKGLWKTYSAPSTKYVWTRTS